MRADHLILDFAAAVAAGPAVAGGKGFQLGRLARYGLPVPDGFVVSSAAHRLAMDDELMAAAGRAGADAEALAAIRTHIRQQALPPEIALALDAALRQRGWQNTSLAVRSSAPAEDSQRASFAGIYHSELNVVGSDALADAVRAVWASLWTPQAVAYRQRLNLDGDDAGMAVVIMPMVPAVAAGVAFSCDPGSGRDDRIVINATLGLADGLVAGHVNGDEIVLQEDGDDRLHLLQKRAASAAAPVSLNDEQALALGELVRRAAFALDYSAPWFDIEWVWDGARFHLVQARPVTARPWHTYPALAGQPAIWTNGNTRDVMPHVMNAADWAPTRKMVNLYLEQSWRLAAFPLLAGAQRAALFQGRLYLNASFIQWEGWDALGVAPAATNRLMGGHQPEITVQPPSLGQRARRLGCLLRYLAGAGRMRRAGQRQAAEAHALCARWRGEQLETIGADELVRRISALQRHARGQTGLMFIQISTGSLSMLLDLVERTLPGESHALVAGLMAGGEPSVTARQGYDLLALAATAATDPIAATWLREAKSGDWQNLPEGNAFRREFADFIERYGHRGIYESYLRTPRWREDAGYLLRRIAELMTCDASALRARQDELRASAHTRLARHFPFWTRKWAVALAKTAKRECNDRESGRSAFTAYIETARRLLLESGRRLAERGDLRSAQQVFHLIPAELAAALAGELSGSALHNLVFDRERQCADWQENPAPEVILAGGGAPLAGPASAVPRRDGACWHGVAVGAGIASGPARCIRDPDQGGRLAAGDILVAPSTDPAWTPLFLKAGGLVMETGGYLSHGAIVAREFGIPAVVNLPGILDALADGAPLEVDGQRGTVRQIS